MSWKRGRRFSAWVYRADGRRRRLSLGTADARTAREMERFLQALKDRREWDVLEAIFDKKLTPGAAFDSWLQDPQLGALRARLNDEDLRDYVDRWCDRLTKRRSEATAKKYLRQLRELVPDDRPFPKSGLSRKRVAAFLSELEARGLTGSTVRRYQAACASFFSYLQDFEVLEVNPAHGLQRPSENPARARWLTLDESLRLVAAHPQPFRALAALREGAGVEIGAALKTKRRDVVDRERRIVQVHGTKNEWRNRPVAVDAPFWRHIEELTRNLLPDALLWPGVTADAARAHHRAACKAVGIDDYRMHDSRHSYAVRHMRLGDNPTLIARNLGHKDASMVLHVYGKWSPTREELSGLKSEATS